LSDTTHAEHDGFLAEPTPVEASILNYEKMLETRRNELRAVLNKNKLHINHQPASLKRQIAYSMFSQSVFFESRDAMKISQPHLENYVKSVECEFSENSSEMMPDKHDMG